MTDQNSWSQNAWGTAAPQGQTPGGTSQGAGAGTPSTSASQPGASQGAGAPQSQPQPRPQPQPQPAAHGYGQGQNPYGYGQSQAAYGAAAQPAYGMPVTAPAPAAAQPAKRRGWIVALAAVVAFFVLGLASIASCTSVMTAPMGAFSAESPSWTETVTGDTVGIINIDGTIQYDGTTSSPEGLKAQLDAAEKNPHIKAVVLRVNSGGGVATAGEEMSRYVREFSKPVVVSCASLDASAAYMISSQADYIYAAETSAVGSIGVIMSVTDLSGLYEKLGISVDNITSADAKDAGGGNRPLTEEERAWFQAQVDQINDVFIRTVAEGRHMSEEEVRALANGLTYTGIDAAANGLIDETGTLEMAVAKACELAGIADADTVYLQSSSSDLSRLLDIMGEQNDDVTTRALKELEDRVGLE